MAFVSQLINSIARGDSYELMPKKHNYSHDIIDIFWNRFQPNGRYFAGITNGWNGKPGRD